MRSKIQTPFTHRQYMLSQDFEIYYYSDTRHNNVDLHSHDYYEFYFYMEGEVEFEIGDRRQALRSGDFVIVPPGTMHRAFVVNTELPYRRFVFWISADFAKQLAEHFADFAFLLNYMRGTGIFTSFTMTRSPSMQYSPKRFSSSKRFTEATLPGKRSSRSG